MVATTDEDALARWIEDVGVAEVLTRLDPWVTSVRRARIDAVLGARLASVSVAIEDPHDPGNAAAIVRTAEAFGVAEVTVIASAGPVLRGRRTARGALPWVVPREHGDRVAFFADLRARGIRSFGACVDGPMTISLADVAVDRPLCLIFGSEQRGLSDEARAACDQLFQIPMFGMVESLNVSVAAGIALQAITCRRRGWLGAAGDLDHDAREKQRAAWYARSVDPRLLENLLRARTPGRTSA